MMNFKPILMICFFIASEKSIYAATTTTSINVTATVSDSCSASNTGVAFLTYAPLSGSATNTTGTVSVTCTKGTAYNIALNVGTGTGASYSLGRVMTSGSDTLKYNLYTSSALTTVWGDATGGTAVVSGTGNGTSQISTIYATIPASQVNSKAGSYTDTVTATINY